jgi:hypothetical protein
VGLRDRQRVTGSRLEATLEMLLRQEVKIASERLLDQSIFFAWSDLIHVVHTLVNKRITLLDDVVGTNEYGIRIVFGCCLPVGVHGLYLYSDTCFVRTAHCCGSRKKR